MDLKYPSGLQKRYANTVFPNLPNELIVEILSNTDEETFDQLCQSPEFRSYCSAKSVFYELIYEEKSKRRLSPDIIEFKEERMSWREFYDRIMHLILNIRNINVVKLAMEGKFIELKVHYKLRESIFPGRVADHVARKGDLDMLKWLNERGVRPNKDGADWAAAKGYIHILKWLASLSPPEGPILPTIFGARLAQINHRNDVVEWLETKGVYPSTR